MTFGIITIILDFILLLLPVPIVWALQLPVKQRLAVCGLFFLGFIVCIAGIIQAYYVDYALVSSYDETWDGWPLWVASAIEVDVGIVSVLAYNDDMFRLDRVDRQRSCVFQFRLYAHGLQSTCLVYWSRYAPPFEV